MREGSSISTLILKFGSVEIGTTEMFSDFFDDPRRDHHVEGAVHDAGSNFVGTGDLSSKKFNLLFEIFT